jgi:hypothetical protein
VLSDDAVFVVPGMVIDAAQFRDALPDQRPWARYTMSESRIVSTGSESWAVIYRATAQREGEPEYRALMTSVYVRSAGGWKLVLHQQTPER